MTKLRSTILAGAAVLAVVLLLAPGVAAQQQPKVTITKVTVPTVPIKPQIENPPIKVDFTYAFDNTALTGSGAASSNAIVDITFQCQNGVTITGPAQVQITVTPGASASFPGSGNFQVSIPRTAPGLQTIPCTVKAKAQPLNAGIQASNEASSPFTVTADYYSVNQVKLASKLKQSGPQKQVPFEMEITNFGNARTQYTFELGASPSGKWNAILPEVLLLDSPNSGQGSPTNTAIFTVATPFKNGWNNLEGAYQIVVKPASADDPSKTGNPLTANMLVRVRGVYVPGLEPMVLLGAVLGSALLLRLRKDEE